MTTLAPPPFAAGGNWLLTSAAAKVDLTRRLRSALNAAGLRLHAADLSPFSAAFPFADAHHLLPSLDDSRFLPVLLDLCAREHIRVLLPTRDAELLYFSRHRDTLLAAGFRYAPIDLAGLQSGAFTLSVLAGRSGA